MKAFLPLGLVIFSACVDKNVGIINSAPEAEITKNEGALILEGYSTSFHASFKDNNHLGLDLVSNWYLDGNPICPDASVSESKESECRLTLDAGTYNISVQVIDAAGASHQDFYQFDVTPTFAPEFTIEYRVWRNFTDTVISMQE